MTAQAADARATAPRDATHAPCTPDAASALAARLSSIDTARCKVEFVHQGAFLYIDDFLPRDITSTLDSIGRALLPAVNRNYLPGHKQGGSVSRHTIDKLAPFVTRLYQSKALLQWLNTITGEKLQPSPDDDAHAYALYYYTRPGDHIGWHYDTSYYEGKRYTLLLGVIDDSSCRLDYELHTRTAGVPPIPGSIQYPPGAMVLFDGDTLRHRITPLGHREMRVSLTFEYVTDASMRPWRRFVSNMKDALAYFGFRQVFGRRAGRRTAGCP